VRDLSESAQVMASAEAWRARHEQPGGAWSVRQDGTSAKAVYDALCAIGSNATAEDVLLLTGDKTLVQPITCDECTRRTWSCVQVGPAHLCARCLHKALGVVMGLVRP
jgi:hypothetical protein